jgi:hypothetical protein
LECLSARGLCLAEQVNCGGRRFAVLHGKPP